MNIKVFFDNTEVEPENMSSILHWQNRLDRYGVKYFHLTDSQYLSCINERNTSYYLESHIVGRGLHFRTCSRKPERAYLFYPQTHCKINVSETFRLKITSIPTSSNPTKIKHFTTFTTLKIIKITFQNPIKPLKIKHFLELNRKHHI